jgi:hypothetical protein
MKHNKIILTLGYISVIPIFFSTIINMIIGMMYWSGVESDKIKFHIGKLNNEFISIVGIFGMLGIAFIIVSMQIANRHQDKMNDLDGAIQKYHDAKKEMEVARDKYTEQLIKK